MQSVKRSTLVRWYLDNLDGESYLPADGEPTNLFEAVCGRRGPRCLATAVGRSFGHSNVPDRSPGRQRLRLGPH